MEKKFIINGHDVERFIIVYPTGKAIEKFLAEELSRMILDATGKTVKAVSDEYVVVEREIRLGKTNRTTLETEEKYTYKIAVKGDYVEAVTDTATGFDDIIAELGRALSAEGDTVLSDGTEISGKVSNPPVIPEEYDLCILYHNILGYLPWYPAHNRAEMGLEIYKEYMPDVIGLQEVSNFYHRDTIATINALEELGYKEIRFPRYGYGNPIYYNAKKLMLLECGYKTARPGDKGTTWSVFEIKRSGGKTFAVLNSHFAANSNANNDPQLGDQYRADDAKIVVEVVEMTKQRYPGIPVFTGGDYNSLLGSEAIRVVTEGGLVNVRDVLTDKTYCDFCAYNGYPKYFEEEKRYRYEEFHLREAAGNIDFAMLGGDQSGVKVIDYVLLKDRISCTVSDHLPHLLHVSLPEPKTEE